MIVSCNHIIITCVYRIISYDFFVKTKYVFDEECTKCLGTQQLFVFRCVFIRLSKSEFLCSKYLLNFLHQGFAGTGYSSYIYQC